MDPNISVSDLEKLPGRMLTIPFFATVPASSSRSYTSKRITTPFITERFHVSFALNTNRTMKVSFYISADDQTPNGPPNGSDVFAALGQVDYLTGDDEAKEVRHQVFIPSSGMYLKVLAVNDDGNEHTLDAQITIRLLPRL